MKTSKLVLGTAQLGLNYGINNSIGKPSLEASFQLLDLAKKLGFTELDTADAYGNASEVLKEYFQKNPNSFKVMSKFSHTPGVSFLESFQASLGRLGFTRLEGYYFHRFSDFLNFNEFVEVQNLKLKGLINKLAVSLYSDEELEVAVAHSEVDVIQLPFNLLDRSTKRIDLLKKAKELNKLVYTRSSFLQGLFFMDPSNLPMKLSPLKEALEQVNKLSKDFAINLEELCLNYVVHKDYIDKVIIGVDSVSQLQANIDSIKFSFSNDLANKIERIDIRNVDLLNPSNWN